jgi:hypothetical protein
MNDRAGNVMDLHVLDERREATDGHEGEEGRHEVEHGPTSLQIQYVRAEFSEARVPHIYTNDDAYDIYISASYN